MIKKDKEVDSISEIKVQPKKRIQTAEGWKRGQLKAHRKEEKQVNQNKSQVA